MLLRARILLPMSGPAIDDGAVEINGGRVARVGKAAAIISGAAEKVIDLGDAILLPGLINAHCHLDYTGFAGCIPPPKSFTTWIQSLVALKGATSLEEFAASWKKGAEMLLRNGVTTVADVEAFPDLLPAQWQTTPLRIISFREIISLKSSQSSTELVKSAAGDVSRWLPHKDNGAGLSPHAPYTTYPSLLQAAARTAQEHKWPLTTHIAESKEEFDMFSARKGPLFDWLSTQREMSDCGGISPVQHLSKVGYLSENLLAIHVNYLAAGDAALLGQSGAHVVHCPRCHDYFGHAPFPVDDLKGAGVNLSLGTDSLASIRTARKGGVELDLFAEMRAFASKHPIPPRELLEMVTIHPARALGRAGELGEITPGARADLIALPYSGPLQDAYEGVVDHKGPVSVSMINGRWEIAPDAGSSP